MIVSPDVDNELFGYNVDSMSGLDLAIITPEFLSSLRNRASSVASAAG